MTFPDDVLTEIRSGLSISERGLSLRQDQNTFPPTSEVLNCFFICLLLKFEFIWIKLVTFMNYPLLLASITLSVCSLAPVANSAVPPSVPPPVQARGAAEFLDSMGICAVIYDNATHESIVVPRLAELGIQHLRVGLKKVGDNHRGNGQIMLNRVKELGEAGYKITGLWSCWYSMDDFLTITEFLLPNSIYQAEGPNEPWNGHENFKWEGEKWPKGPALYMEDMHTALKSRETTRNIPILSFSGTTSAYKSIEQWLDYGNEHIYSDNGESLTEKGQLQKLIERCRATQYPTKPLQFTEAGYNSDPKGYRGTSIEVQARGVPRIFLETFKSGIVRTFIYGLIMKDDAGFSLLHPDGQPKPAFLAVKAMREILKDTAVEGFTPGSLAFQVEAPVPSVHHLLLQRSDGVFFLCLWNDIGGWDAKTKKDKRNPDQSVQISFAKNPSKVSSYRPLTNGKDALETKTVMDQKMTVDVPDHPLILEIVPGP